VSRLEESTVPRGLITASLMIAMYAAAPALADGGFPPVADQTVRDECSGCHIAYQPQMLPQRSWRRLMDGLADHFGEELSLEGETAEEVLRYLLDNAADVSAQKEARKFLRGLRPGADPIRITDTPRWKKKHDELPERVWSDPRIAFRGECEVCHTKTERGLYDEDDGLRIPGPNGSWRGREDD
jgi:hypothetical protein